MASSSSEKRPCSKCGCSGWVVACEGCQDLFCIPHAGEHRTELSAQLTSLLEQSNHFKDMYSDHHQRISVDHPLFSQIDVWEHDTIAKIVQTARIAREKLREVLEESNYRIKSTFERFNEQLENVQSTGYFTEIHLKQWNERFREIRNQMEIPCHAELLLDEESSPIQLVKIHIPEENGFDSNASTVQITDGPCHQLLLTTTQNCSDELTDELEFYFDRTADYHLVLFQLSSTVQSQLASVLSRLTSDQIEIFNENEEERFLNQLQSSRQTTVFLDCFDRRLNEQHELLEKISQIDNVHSIYIRGIPSVNEAERADFFRRYSKIQAVFAHEQCLIVQWAMDTTNELKRTGDRYVENGESMRGRFYFQRGIALYQNLSIYLNEKRRIRS